MDSHIGTIRIVYNPATGRSERVKVGALKNGAQPFKGYAHTRQGVGCGACPVWRDVPTGGHCAGCQRA